MLVGDELLADLLVEAAVAGIFPLDDLSVEPADFLLVSVHGLPDQVLNVLGAVAQDDEALDLPVGESVIVPAFRIRRMMSSMIAISRSRKRFSTPGSQ